MLRVGILLAFVPSLVIAQQSGWGNVGNDQAAVFSWEKWWTEPLFPGFWMAWTRATLAVFVFIFSSIGVMGFLEYRRPGGAERDGVLGLTTTRGDRLFISLLGTVYIFLAWLGLIGTPLWWPMGLAMGWAAFCFWKV